VAGNRYAQALDLSPGFGDFIKTRSHARISREEKTKPFLQSENHAHMGHRFPNTFNDSLIPLGL